MTGYVSAHLRTAARAVVRERRFFALSTVVLGLGFGISITVFGLANQVLLRPVPGVASPDRAAYLHVRRLGSSPQVQGLSLADVDLLRVRSTSLDGLASHGLAEYVVTGGESHGTRVLASWIVGDFFELLGVQPSAGRLLTASETGPDADPRAVVISARLSHQLYDGAESAVGRTLLLNGESVTVVGVAGEGFQGPERWTAVDLWVPYSALEAFNGFPREVLTDSRSTMHDRLTVRLRRGVDARAAESELAEVLRAIPRQTDGAAQTGVLQPSLEPGLRLPPTERLQVYLLVGLFGAASLLVLLISCGNVSTLLLMRGTSRQAATATRISLGASPGRIVADHLTESLLLAVLGSLCGVVVAWLITQGLVGERLARLPGLGAFTVDTRTVAFVAAIAVGCTAVFGTLPAVLAARSDAVGILRGGSGMRHRLVGKATKLLAAGQVALCAPLLVGAVLLTRTVDNLYSTDLGVTIPGLWSARLGSVVDVPDAAIMQLRYRELAARVAEIPGVEDAAVDRAGPFGETMVGRVAPARSEEGDAHTVSARPVTVGWFRTLEVDLVSGGPLTEQVWNSQAVPTPVVLSLSLAQRLFDGRNPIGEPIQVGAGELRSGVVVGVTEHIRAPADRFRPIDSFFVPLGSLPVPQTTLLVRSDELTAATVDDLLGTVRAVLGTEVVTVPTALSDQLETVFTEQRIIGHVLRIAALGGLLLAAIGLYGVVSFVVQGRFREFAVRRALGAGAGDIVLRVASAATVVVAVGGALGLLGATMLAALLNSRLYGVTPLDPASYAAAALLLVMVAVGACWRPAAHAASSHPIEFLKTH